MGLLWVPLPTRMVGLREGTLATPLQVNRGGTLARAPQKMREETVLDRREVAEVPTNKYATIRESRTLQKVKNVLVFSHFHRPFGPARGAACGDLSSTKAAAADQTIYFISCLTAETPPPP